MKKLLFIVLGLVVVLAAAVVAAPFLIPVDSYKAQIAERVSRATGRNFTITGPVRLSLLPRVQLEAEQVALANAPGAAVPSMASLEKLQVQLQPMPLLSGQLVVDRFVLVGPVIRLEIDKLGHPNWQFGAAGKPAPAGAPAAAGNQAAALEQLRLGDVRIENGTLSYADQRSGASHELTKVNARLALASLDEPLAIEGNAVWRDKPVTVKLDLASARAVMDGGNSALALRLSAQAATVDFAGSIANATPPRLEGGLKAEIPSVRELAAWAGSPLPPGGGMGRATLAGKLAASAGKAHLTETTLSLDAIEAKGELGVVATGSRPLITGKLDLPMLDLNPYSAPTPAAAGGSAPAPGNAAAPQGWSNEPIDLDGLRVVDAQLALAAGGIRLKKIEIGRSAVAVQLKDGRLVADLSQITLYRGSGQARIGLDGAATPPALDLTAKLTGIQAEPLLHAFADFDRLTGTGALELAVTAKGRSQQEMVAALNGRGAVTFRDGAVKGINIGAMLRNIGSALQAGGTGSDRTDFSELSATYVIANGILRNSDLKLQSPLLRVEGAGAADLPHQTLDYRLTPKLVASAEGQGGRGDLSGITVPVMVQGPWAHLSYKPDLAGAVQQNLRDPNRLIESLRGGNPAGSSSGSSGSSPKPADVLRGILGR